MEKKADSSKNNTSSLTDRHDSLDLQENTEETDDTEEQQEEQEQNEHDQQLNDLNEDQTKEDCDSPKPPPLPEFNEEIKRKVSANTRRQQSGNRNKTLIMHQQSPFTKNDITDLKVEKKMRNEYDYNAVSMKADLLEEQFVQPEPVLTLIETQRSSSQSSEKEETAAMESRRSSVLNKGAVIKSRASLHHGNSLQDASRTVQTEDRDDLTKNSSRENEWYKTRFALSQQASRFELPMDMKTLETMTPADYLRKHCVIASQRQSLYHKFFMRNKDKSGVLRPKDLEKTLSQVLVNTITKEQVNDICSLVQIDPNSEQGEDSEQIDIKLFSGIAALAERLLYTKYLTPETSDLEENKKLGIESADFGALEWKLKGLNVDQTVKTLLKVL